MGGIFNLGNILRIGALSCDDKFSLGNNVRNKDIAVVHIHVWEILSCVHPGEFSFQACTVHGGFLLYCTYMGLLSSDVYLDFSPVVG